MALIRKEDAVLELKGEQDELPQQSASQDQAASRRGGRSRVKETAAKRRLRRSRADMRMYAHLVKSAQLAASRHCSASKLVMVIRELVQRDRWWPPTPPPPRQTSVLVRRPPTPPPAPLRQPRAQRAQLSVEAPVGAPRSPCEAQVAMAPVVNSSSLRVDAPCFVPSMTPVVPDCGSVAPLGHYMSQGHSVPDQCDHCPAAVRTVLAPVSSGQGLLEGPQQASAVEEVGVHMVQQFSVGDVVVVVGLPAASRNGRCGVIAGSLDMQGRLPVRLHSGRVLVLDPTNLALPSSSVALAAVASIAGPKARAKPVSGYWATTPLHELFEEV